MTNGTTRLNPEPLATPAGFSHVALAARSGQIAFISGQVSYDSAGEVVGTGDMGAQTQQVFENLQHALAAIGANFKDVLKFTFFVKDMSPQAIAEIRRVRANFLDQDALPASTMVGVAALAKPELLLEVEAYVVINAV